MLTILLNVLLIAAIGALFYWAVGKVGTPDPLKNWLLVAIVVLCALWALAVIGGVHDGYYRIIRP